MADVREDFRKFAAMLGVELWQHQIEAANSDAFITTIAAARRTGKTTLVELLASWTAMRDAGVVVVVLSATQDASRRVTESIGQRLAANKLTAGAVVDDYKTRIRLGNGSEIVSLPASQRQVRGYGRGVRLLIIDEAGFVPDELWRAAWPVALDERQRGSRILLTGTPWGSAEHFFRTAFKAGVDGDSDYESFHWTYLANPNLDRQYLERQRERIAPAEYAAEVLGEWSDAAGSLFNRELLNAQTADIIVPAMSALEGRPLIGFDHGVSFDRSALAVVYRLPDNGLNPHDWLPRFIALPYSWPQATALSETVKDVAAIPARAWTLTTETNGVGAMPSQEIGRLLRERNREPHHWNFCATTAAKKTAGYGTVLSLLERGQLILPRDPGLLRQLAGLRFEHGERGFTRIGAEDAAVHDDLADALMLATAPHVPHGQGRVQTHLLQLASPRAAPPDADLHPLDCEVVETGNGRRVYSQPALQSVAGIDFNLPVGVSQQRPPAPEDRVGRFVINPKARSRT